MAISSRGGRLRRCCIAKETNLIQEKKMSWQFSNSHCFVPKSRNRHLCQNRNMSDLDSGTPPINVQPTRLQSPTTRVELWGNNELHKISNLDLEDSQINNLRRSGWKRLHNNTQHRNWPQESRADWKSFSKSLWILVSAPSNVLNTCLLLHQSIVYISLDLESQQQRWVTISWRYILNYVCNSIQEASRLLCSRTTKCV